MQLNLHGQMRLGEPPKVSEIHQGIDVNTSIPLVQQEFCGGFLRARSVRSENARAIAGMLLGKRADTLLRPVQHRRAKPTPAPLWNNPSQMQVEPGAICFCPPGETDGGDHFIAMQSKEHVLRVAISK